MVHLHTNAGSTEPAFVEFVDCTVADGGAAGLVAGGASPDGPRGLVRFVRTTVTGTAEAGLKMYGKSVDGVDVHFVNVSIANTTNNPPARYGGAQSPIFMEGRYFSAPVGGVLFDGVTVRDAVARPFFSVYNLSAVGLAELRGSLQVHNPTVGRGDRTGCEARLGDNVRRDTIALDVSCDSASREQATS